MRPVRRVAVRPRFGVDDAPRRGGRGSIGSRTPKVVAPGRPARGHRGGAVPIHRAPRTTTSDAPGGSTLRQRNGSPIAAACGPPARTGLVSGFHPVVRRRRRCVSRAVRAATDSRRARTWVWRAIRPPRPARHRIDAVVFEQYKGQAAAGRTYLPMPFAHVLGGDGWGFHVRTSRRVWFDVGASDADACGWRQKLAGARARNCMSRSTTAARRGAERVPDRDRKADRVTRWVHRLWASGNEWNTQERVVTEIDRHSPRDIPVGVVVVEAWSDESTFAAFRDASTKSTRTAHRTASPTSRFRPTGRGPTRRAWLTTSTRAT